MKNNFKEKTAFTLSEVLITLGIIGIVSALTIPTIIKKYNAVQTISKLKQAHSLLNNAYLLSVIDNGRYAQWEIGNNAEVYINTYFKPYFKNATLCLTYKECGYNSATPIVDKPITYVARKDLRLPLKLSNGIYFMISVATGNANNPALIKKNTLVFIDLNGSKKPNRTCEDIFTYKVTNRGVEASEGGTSEIMNNSWKFPENYSKEYNIESF